LHFKLETVPAVKRTKNVTQPIVQEINAAQAAFASHFCFTNINSAALDEVLQKNFGKAQLGVTSFTVWHRNYDNLCYEMLMNNGKIPESHTLIDDGESELV
jgi:hypothetical protein